jgi:hypothetical protein
MVEKQKGVKKKKVIRHEAAAEGEKPEPEKKSLPVKPPMSSRPKESNAGFGVLKGVAGVIILLIVGSAILFNRAGGQDAMRGDKKPGDNCAETTECQKGSICFAYQNDRHRCMQTCSPKHPCDTGYSCRTASTSKRKGVRLAEVCVSNALL